MDVGPRRGVIFNHSPPEPAVLCHVWRTHGLTWEWAGAAVAHRPSRRGRRDWPSALHPHCSHTGTVVVPLPRPQDSSFGRAPAKRKARKGRGIVVGEAGCTTLRPTLRAAAHGCSRRSADVKQHPATPDEATLTGGLACWRRRGRVPPPSSDSMTIDHRAPAPDHPPRPPSLPQRPLSSPPATRCRRAELQPAPLSQGDGPSAPVASCSSQHSLARQAGSHSRCGYVLPPCVMEGGIRFCAGCAVPSLRPLNASPTCRHCSSGQWLPWAPSSSCARDRPCFCRSGIRTFGGEHSLLFGMHRTYICTSNGAA